MDDPIFKKARTACGTAIEEIGGAGCPFLIPFWGSAKDWTIVPLFFIINLVLEIFEIEKMEQEVFLC